MVLPGEGFVNLLTYVFIELPINIIKAFFNFIELNPQTQKALIFVVLIFLSVIIFILWWEVPIQLINIMFGLLT